ncbi:unnamed protein product [Nesidiocoris tenuis]|uniref:Uncharacterized protein n=1 Tax=Nesidiocoris tenuis TaxID=355587 RepID=A0A6H5GUK1_9HEMI|nr:unnamed protein product [Nesidiocoris tenuis]
MWDLTAYGGSVSHRVNFTIEFLTNDADCNGCAVYEGYLRGFKCLGSHDYSILIHQLYCRLLQLLFFDFQIATRVRQCRLERDRKGDDNGGATAPDYWSPSRPIIHIRSLAVSLVWKGRMTGTDNGKHD